MHANPGNLSAGDISCVACGALNPSARKFCSECGEGLWTHCPGCHESVSVSEKFCGSCGENLEANYQARLGEFQAKVEEAKAIAGEQRYDDAIVALRITLREVPELLRHEAENSRPLIEEWEKARDQAFEDAAQLIKDAQAAVNDCHYKRAEELLGSIPEAVLTDSMRSLLAEARGKRRDVHRLKQRIEEALRNKKGATLMGDLESLVQLLPNDPKPRKLAEQIRDQLCELAKRKFERQQFEDAWAAISRVREFVANDRSRSLAKSIERACWLFRNLKFASHVDSSLADNAIQLARLAPQDAKLAKIQNEIAVRVQKSRGRRPIRLPAWDSAEARGQSILGIPVDYLDWSDSFEGEEKLDAEGGPFAARFTIAAGLAMQGIGLASLDVQLSGTGKRGLLGQLSRTFSRTAQAAWGLHFGSTALKVVRMESRGKDKPPAITHSGLFPFSDSLAAAASDFERRDVIRNTLVDAQRALLLKEDPLIVSLAAVPILARFPKMPRIEKNKIAECLEREASHQIPFPLNEVHWASHMFDEPNVKQNLSVLMMAIKQSEWTVFNELFQTLGFSITAIQSEAVAMNNIYQFWLDRQIATGKLPESRLNQSAGLLHAGGDGTHICLSHRNGIWFRYIPSGGVRLTRNLVVDLNLRGDQAETAKTTPLKSAETANIFRSISAPLGEQIAEVKRTLDVAIREDPSMKPKMLWVTGGASLQHGYIRAFRRGPESIAMGPPMTPRTTQPGGISNEEES